MRTYIMELSEFVAKSVLKKSNTLNSNVKKVSFSETVKLYIDDPSKKSSCSDDGISPMRWVEIAIVDKSYDSSLLDSSFEDCKVSDFLVHKVVYDSDLLNENDNEVDIQNEEIDQECLVFESPKDEDLEFVVHKVTEHEDDLIEKELELENSFLVETENKSELDNKIESNVKFNDVTKSLSELSVKNILEHDKLIAYIDQRSLCLPSLQNTLRILDNTNLPGCRSNTLINTLPNKDLNSLGLSPPLQELSLDKIVKAHSDNILEALDISPLNSVQETDSDSDLSSEGTMIMMTTEECEKNEQNIRESLLKYQALKEKEAKASLSEQLGSAIDINTKTSNNLPSDIENNPDSLNSNLKLDTPPENSVISISDSSFSDSYIESSHHPISSELCRFDSETEPPPPKDCRSLSLSDIELLRSMCENSFQQNSNNSRKGSFENNVYWEKSLASVEIPKDVREWKIFLNSFKKDINERLEYDDANCKLQSDKQSENEKDSFLDDDETSDYDGSSNQIDALNYDELESFVHENTERVERIRKRYLNKNRTSTKLNFFPHSSVQKARPQFGSTAQILHLMHKQNNPPFYTYSGTKNHMSWPCDDVTCDGGLVENLKHRHSSRMYACSSSDCSSHSSFDSDEHLNSGSDRISISSNSSLFMQERGRPEGASPPKPGVEDCFEQSYEEGPDGLVYFSMKV